jgi:CRISPR-associated RAMP protein (TIGR02581 family)
MALWDTFESRFIIKAQLKTVTGLRVGAGGSETAQPAASDLPVLVGADDRPLIPGSSLRGVIRSQIERIVRTLEPKSDEEGFFGRGACNPVVGAEWCIKSDRMKEIRQKATDKKAQADQWLGEKVWQESCRVCRTFGNSWFASRVRIADLHLVNPNEFRIERRDGVAIHREKDTVQHKYDFEVLPKETRFQLRITAENLSPAELGLLWLGLRELDEGNVLIGGFKGRGLGQVKLGNVDIRGVQSKDRAALRRYIIKRELTPVTREEADGWLEALWQELEAE